ncbi:DUF4915 domain-containing protein [Trinickia dinghuensis]|uniref:DUF4915 domain-containing protein n=1 Tax=Trinickia dinghuensis TaxID=2291023 RepID=A0A3D8JVC1_9BURK|nr:DUF4915 domain-containing protein [Trinickia dinghuensis]RDU96742.1 DUF4915 domain-containing protein [Trinickia dinghuensis]
MPRLLVSFCYTRPLGHAIARLDTENGAFEWVDVSSVPAPVYGAAGLVRVDMRYYAALQVKFGEALGTYLVELDEQARVTRAAPLPHIYDAHSMIAHGDELLLVGSGTNQVFALSWPDGGPPASRVYYEQAPGIDTLHMNSLQVFDGRVYLSMFGPRPDAEWHHADEGQILDLNAGGAVVARGLRHPHSLTVVGDTLMCLDSRSGTMIHVAGDPRSSFARLPGYLRGACAVDGRLYVGASVTRKRSKSRGTANAPPVSVPSPDAPAMQRVAAPTAPGMLASDGCGLHVIDAAATASTGVSMKHAVLDDACDWIDLSPFAPELYDVIPWYGAPVHGSRPAAMEQRLRAVNDEFTDLVGAWRRMLLQRLHMRELVREIDAARSDLPAVQRIAALARETERFWSADWPTAN